MAIKILNISKTIEEDSNSVVTGGAVYTAMSQKVDKSTIDQVCNSISSNTSAIGTLTTTLTSLSDALDNKANVNHTHNATTIMVDTTQTPPSSGGGTGTSSGGTSNYNDLSNKPRINNIELSGNKSLNDLGINVPTNVSQLNNDAGYLTATTLIAALPKYNGGVH